MYILLIYFLTFLFEHKFHEFGDLCLFAPTFPALRIYQARISHSRQVFIESKKEYKTDKENEYILSIVFIMKQDQVSTTGVFASCFP